MDDGPYEEFDPEFQFLDLSGRNLGYQGILEVLKDLAGDQVLRQVRFNYNILAEEFRDPKAIEEFIRLFKKIMVKHRSTVVAIDLAGNHLFDNHPHPVNEHKKNYQEALTIALKSSKITHLDLSDNNITGNTGRELYGLTYMMKHFMVHGKAFKCRHSKINSQGLWAVSNCLGDFSSLTFLDLSCNFAGLDPLGRQNSEGTAALAMALKGSLHMRVLKIAENHLVDDDFVHICDALCYMPRFQDLDVASNQCRTNGARALKLAIISHSIFADDRCGFRHVDLSNNPLGDGGVKELSEALYKTYTLRTLKLRACRMTDAGCAHLVKALQINASVRLLEIENNELSPPASFAALAEVQAANDIDTLRVDPQGVDANALSVYAYKALARKLRFLDRPQLAALHGNPSFNVPESEMQEALHMLEPPPRHELVEEVKHSDEKMLRRLAESALANRRIFAARTIYHFVREWFEPLRVEFNIRKAVAAAAKRRAELNVRNTDDDRFN